MNVRDTELYEVHGRINLHGKTKRRPRLSDGKEHPVTIIQPAMQEKEVKHVSAV